MNAKKIVTFSLSLLCLLGMAGANAMEQPEKPDSLKKQAAQAIYKNSIAPLLKDVTAENIDQTYDDIMKEITKLKNELPKELVEYLLNPNQFSPNQKINNLVASKLVELATNSIYTDIKNIQNIPATITTEIIAYNKKRKEIIKKFDMLKQSKTFAHFTYHSLEHLDAHDRLMNLIINFKTIHLPAVSELPQIKSAIGNTLGLGEGIALTSAMLNSIQFMEQKGLSGSKAFLTSQLIFIPIHTIIAKQLEKKYGENAALSCLLGIILFGCGNLLKSLHNK